jgi:hypothetical protein
VSSSLKVSGKISFKPDDFLPKAEDIYLALEQQKSRILARTARGVDVNEQEFTPYNDTRPYYFYPAGPVGKNRSKEQLKRDKAAVTRFAKKVGGTPSRSRLGLKFPSYRAFKLDYLGRSNVDLYGPRAPHMLQAMTIRTQGGTSGTLGIYGDEAKRANGISGEDRPKGMPRRQFFAASDSDQQAMAETIRERIQARLDRLR